MKALAIKSIVFVFKYFVANKKIWEIVHTAVTAKDEEAWKSGETKAKEVFAEVLNTLRGDAIDAATWLINFGIELAVLKLKIVDGGREPVTTIPEV